MVMKERCCCGQAAEKRYYLGGSIWPWCGGKAKTKEGGMEDSPAGITGCTKVQEAAATASLLKPWKGSLRDGGWDGVRDESEFTLDAWVRREWGPPWVLSRGWFVHLTLGPLGQQQHGEESGGEKRQEAEGRDAIYISDTEGRGQSSRGKEGEKGNMRQKKMSEKESETRKTK